MNKKNYSLIFIPLMVPVNRRKVLRFESKVVICKAGENNVSLITWPYYISFLPPLYSFPKSLHEDFSSSWCLSG